MNFSLPFPLYYIFPQGIMNPDKVIKYISRYLGRPVIATSRIDSYDGEYVTFHNNNHEDNSYVERTVPVLDFISLLIQHIPEKHFKMTRYFGLYARHRNSDEKLRWAIPKSRHRILLDFNKWRQIILLSFGYDPLQCPKCNHKMEFLKLPFIYDRISCHAFRFLIVAGKMLYTCCDTFLLQAFHIGASKLPRKTGVLGKIFKIPATKRTSLYIESRP